VAARLARALRPITRVNAGCRVSAEGLSVAG